jgi:two-component system sensor histidine kinase/response regulator
LDVVESMRRNSLSQSGVIMMLTTRDQVRSAELCRQMGVEFIVVKPISSADLLTAMQRAVGLHTPVSASALPAAVVTAPSQSLNILLAEDNLVNQRVAIAMLGKMGHHVTLATNGLEALEQWRQRKFDLIFMDVQMPEMTGLEATMHIRRQEAPGVRVPIVAMTASAMSEERDRCLAAGMDDFISKPVSYKVIEQMIATTCPSETQS